MNNDYLNGFYKEVSSKNYCCEIHLSPLNKRLVVKNYEGPDITSLAEKLIKIAQDKKYTKVWVKPLRKHAELFKKVKYKTEAVIKNYYPDHDAISMAFYLSEKRKNRRNKGHDEQILTDIRKLKAKKNNISGHFHFKTAKLEDISRLADLYNKVFDSYPYPINKPAYLKKMINNDVIYGVIYKQDKLISAASAETIPEYKNAEMTDFATLPNYRGRGLAGYILQKLEESLQERNYNSLYTIARSKVYGINKIFSQSGYEYTGTLVNNCNIDGGFEDMNLWSKII